MQKKRIGAGLSLLVLASVAALGAAPSFAQGTFYVVTETNRLGTVNVSNGAYTDIGALGTLLTDIAVAPNGSLYGVDFENLYSINGITGAASLIGNAGLGSKANLNALVFQNNTLYTANLTDFSLYTLSTTTGAASLVGYTGYQSSGDLAFDNQGNLYLSTYDTAASDRLVKLNTTTGAGTVVGSFGAGLTSMYGLAFQPSGSTLYGYSFAANQIVAVNMLTGAATVVTANQGPKFYGAAFLGEASVTPPPPPPPVAPEPGTLTLAVFGITSAGLIRRRRRA